MRIHRLLLSFVAILATGGSALVGQQQAAEAPASARPARHALLC